MEAMLIRQPTAEGDEQKMNEFDPDALMKAQAERMKRAQAAAEAELRSGGRTPDRYWRAEEAARSVLTRENPAARSIAIWAEARRARELAEIAIREESLVDPRASEESQPPAQLAPVVHSHANPTPQVNDTDHDRPVLTENISEGNPRGKNANGQGPNPNGSVTETHKHPRLALDTRLRGAETLTPDLRLRGKLFAVIRYNHFLEELRSIKAACKKYQTPDLLKRQFPAFDVWAALDKSDVADIVAGEFVPGRFSWSLVKRLNGLSGKDDRTLKNYRRALRAAHLSF